MTAQAFDWLTHQGRRQLPRLFERGVPIVMVTTLITILIFSDVPPNLIVAEGRWAEALLVAYAAAMTALAIKPASFNLHRIALPLGIAAWMGRGGGFLDLVINLGRYDLLGAVVERGVILALLLYFHSTEVKRHAHAEALTRA